MGCDIHAYLEHEVTGEYGEKKWVAVSPAKMDRIIKSRATDNARWAHDKSMLRHVRTPFYHGRNYSLFSMLSNVRNYDLKYLTDGGNCLSPDRKKYIMPRDVSDKIFNLWRHGEGDWHSLTVLTLEDILIKNKDFWEQTCEGEDWVKDENGKDKRVNKTWKYSELAHEFLENCNDIAAYAKWKGLDKWRVVLWYDN